MKIQASVSFKNYIEKPNDKDLKEMIFVRKEMDVCELADYISAGHSSCHTFQMDVFISCNKTIKNFNEAYFIILDFDHSLLPFENIMEASIIKPSIAFETFSNTSTDFRFKLIYVLEEPIKSIQDYKRFTEMVFRIAFDEEYCSTLLTALDTSCYSGVQMFHGTDKQVVVSDTIISLDLLNQTIDIHSNPFQSYDDVFNTLNIGPDFKPKSSGKAKSNPKTKSKKSCPKKRSKRIKLYNLTDLSLIPENGTIINDLFDMGINSEVLFMKSPYNNYNTIRLSDDELKNVYCWVGDQKIYSVNTYYVGGKQRVGARKRTLKYTALVLRNLNPYITEDKLFLKLKRYVITYFEKPGDLDDEWIRRLALSTINMTKPNDTGRKCFILNPDYNHLTKSEKMKALHKRKSEFIANYITGKYDQRLSFDENLKIIPFHQKTIKKYLDREGMDYDSKKVNKNFDLFKEVISNPDNAGKSIRDLASLCGISKSQVQRYQKKMGL